MLHCAAVHKATGQDSQGGRSSCFAAPRAAALPCLWGQNEGPLLHPASCLRAQRRCLGGCSAGSRRSRAAYPFLLVQEVIGLGLGLGFSFTRGRVAAAEQRLPCSASAERAPHQHAYRLHAPTARAHSQCSHSHIAGSSRSLVFAGNEQPSIKPRARGKVLCAYADRAARWAHLPAHIVAKQLGRACVVIALVQRADEHGA